ncbi:MAG: hypothetical protein AB7F53_06165 [Nitrososphaeraceae archaeon]
MDDELSTQENPNYFIVQGNKECGFLILKLENNEKTVVGEFITGDDGDEIFGKFELIKS